MLRMFAHAADRAGRGAEMARTATPQKGFHRGVTEGDRRPGDIEFPPERIAEAERRKALAKEAERAKWSTRS